MIEIPIGSLRLIIGIGMISYPNRRTVRFVLREYMEYHADRFTDYSLLVYDGNKLLALLPANRSGDVLYSHAGLTYGGLIVTARNTTAQVLEIMRSIADF